MAFQAPAWAPWREVRKGLYCVRLRVTVGRGRSIAAQARPRVADTAPLSGERDVLWNGSSAQRLFARNADLCGMSSSALAAKPQSRDTTPEEWESLEAVQLGSAAHELAQKESRGYLRVDVEWTTSGRRLARSLIGKGRVGAHQAVADRCCRRLRRDHGRRALQAAE
jgi:hypothetical protein